MEGTGTSPKGTSKQAKPIFKLPAGELEEETGIKQIRVIPGFAREIEYFFRHKSRGLIRKRVIFFLAETQSDDIRLSDEHTGYVFERIEEAMKRVTYKTALAVLREADAF